MASRQTPEPPAPIEAGDDLEPEFVPPLIELLRAAEQEKGSPLTEAEVISIRDDATIVVMTRDDRAEIVRRRGFSDPERAWEEWTRMRTH